ncbi:retinoblastoma-binding protein 5 homolog [Artemia franciscana]|uniref:Retinoblastoma-binding protein 5 n=2 Tax=Artemia franciscana TaxID=6661 RepID=A0AA88KY55_ARTSF|nr:hypothetical protein QYM36_016475 [Artemia franciscana]
MNLELLESFGQNYPEEFDGVLDCISVAVTCTFNRLGTLLAVGCNDGRIVFWDFLTRGIAKVISAHVHPVCCVSFNRRGYKLVSASIDNTVAIWDILTGECDQKYRFPSPILKVQFHPRDDGQFLVCPMRHAAVLVTVDGGHRIIPPEEEDNDLNIVASFDRRGDHIYTGNGRGKVLVLCSKTLENKASFKVTQGTTSVTAIKTIEFSRRGNSFLLNSADRIIRVYDSKTVLECGKDGDPEPLQRLQDLVNKTTWKKCCFSGDGEYVCAGSARQHALYIWEKSIGNIVKILHGTKGELLLDVVWHPLRPIIASVASGVVSIWSQTQVENWSAFAPDFKELDENVEYEERESEFDLEDEDRSITPDEKKQDEDIEVDVTSIEPIAACYSSDEEEDRKEQLLFLPVAPEIEEPEDTWGIEGLDSLETGRKSGDSKENSSPKKKRPKTYDIQLENPPINELHPLLASKPSKDKSTYSGKRAGRPPNSKKGDRGKPGK